jgi:hypothetical protein
VRVRISHPELSEDLLGYLARSGCLAVRTGVRVLAVSADPSLSYDAARMDVELRLTEWRARNAPASADVID